MSESNVQELRPIDPAEPAGRSVETFAKEVGMSRPGIYALPPDLMPEYVKVGRRRIITERPRDWLRRVAQQGQPA